MHHHLVTQALARSALEFPAVIITRYKKVLGRPARITAVYLLQANPGGTEKRVSHRCMAAYRNLTV